MLQRLKNRRIAEEGGFTLIELLVVIIILGILAAVVVFAVGGINDKGQTSACRIDTRTLRTSAEAYSASPGPNGGNGTYTIDEGVLVSKGFLSQPSTLHNLKLTNPADPKGGVDVTIQDADAAAKCGGTAGATTTGTDIN